PLPLPDAAALPGGRVGKHGLVVLVEHEDADLQRVEDVRHRRTLGLRLPELPIHAPMVGGRLARPRRTEVRNGLTSSSVHPGGGGCSPGNPSGRPTVRYDTMGELCATNTVRICCRSTGCWS